MLFPRVVAQAQHAPTLALLAAFSAGLCAEFNTCPMCAPRGALPTVLRDPPSALQHLLEAHPARLLQVSTRTPQNLPAARACTR